MPPSKKPPGPDPNESWICALCKTESFEIFSTNDLMFIKCAGCKKFIDPETLPFMKLGPFELEAQKKRRQVGRPAKKMEEDPFQKKNVIAQWSRKGKLYTIYTKISQNCTGGLEEVMWMGERETQP